VLHCREGRGLGDADQLKPKIALARA
jgi:hypothetical protein